MGTVQFVERSWYHILVDTRAVFLINQLVFLTVCLFMKQFDKSFKKERLIFSFIPFVPNLVHRKIWFIQLGYIEGSQSKHFSNFDPNFKFIFCFEIKSKLQKVQHLT